VTLGNELVPVTSPEKAIPVELKVLTSESNGDWDKVGLKHSEGGYTVDMMLRPAPAGGGQHLVLVVQLVGKDPMSPAIVAQGLKSLVDNAVRYATGGHKLRTLESIEDLPLPVPTVDDPESGPLYVLVKEEGCEDPQPWQVRGDAWRRGVPARLDVGKLKYLNPRMLCRCAIKGMPGSWYIEAGEQAAADDALATAVRKASSASWDELSSITELQTANGNSRNTHNEGLLAIAAKLLDAGLLELGNFVSEAKEHLGVRVNGVLLTICTATSTSTHLEFSTDRGSHGRAPLSLGIAPSLLIVTFSGAVLENQAWKQARSAGGMFVPDEAMAEEVVGAERRSTPLERVVAVLPLDPDVWAPHTAPPKKWHTYIATLVRQFARFAGVPAPLLHSHSKPPAAGSLDALAVDMLCAGIGTIDDLPTLVKLCANAKAFKKKIATVQAARLAAQKATLGRLEKAVEKRGREAAEEAQERGLELKKSESTESGYACVQKKCNGGWEALSRHTFLGIFASREEAAVAVAVADHQAHGGKTKRGKVVNVNTDSKQKAKRGRPA